MLRERAAVILLHSKIIQIGSALAYRGIPLQSAYCRAKHAIEGFTESVRAELLHNKSKIQLTMVQLSAVNTPQFNWGRSKFSTSPQPVPPVFQPELVAKTVAWAAKHKRRELAVTLNTSAIIFLNKLFPGLGDRYLARTGYSSQLSDRVLEPFEEDNLYESVSGNFGAHGAFTKQAKSESLFLKSSTNRGKIAAGFGFLISLLVLLSLNRQK